MKKRLKRGKWREDACFSLDQNRECSNYNDNGLIIATAATVAITELVSVRTHAQKYF